MIGITFHGIQLNLSADNDELLGLMANLLEPCVTRAWPSPDLDVRARWIEAAAPWPDPIGDDGELDQIGKGLRVTDEGGLLGSPPRDPDLRLGFRREGERLQLDVAYRYRTSERKQRDPLHRNRKYRRLLRYLVLFPAAWQLQRVRGWQLLNASVAAQGDEALVICGPAGSGKTTTCVALARSGFRAVSENPVLSDGENVYATYRPFCLTDESLRLLGGSADGLVPVRTAAGRTDKSWFRPADPPDEAPLRAAAVILPRLTRSSYVRRLPPNVATRVLAATDRLSITMIDYAWYSAILDLMWPDSAVAPTTIVDRLAATTPIYEIGIDPRAGLDAMVAMLMDEVWSDVASHAVDGPRA